MSKILWNKEGSPTQTLNSEIGPNFVPSGTPADYVPAKFDDGLRIDVNTELVQLINTPAQFDFAKGMIGFWFTSPVNIVAGKPASGLKCRIMTWWKSSNSYMQWTFHNTLGLIWNIFDGVSNKGWNNPNPNINLSAGVPEYLLFPWDFSGIGATIDVRRMYVGGVLAGNNTSPCNDVDMTSADFTIGLLFNGSYLISGSTDNDNIKWDDNPTEANILAENANRNNEGEPSVYVPGNNLNDGLNQGLMEGVN